MREKGKRKEKRKEKKGGFEQVFRSLRRSRVRTEILMFLYKCYPNASYPAEISRKTGINPANVLGGLRGMGNRFDAGNSLLKHGVVEKKEHGNATYYRLSELGKSLIESAQGFV